VFGAFVDEEARRFEEAIKRSRTTGIDVIYEGSNDSETLISVRVEGGNPPRYRRTPQPGLKKNFASQGNWSPMWPSLWLLSIRTTSGMEDLVRMVERPTVFSIG
jgi:hypothetical protein